MNILNRVRAKITFTTIITSLLIAVILWSCLFVTDYIMFNKGLHVIFCKTDLATTEKGHATKEQGLGYYIYSLSDGVESSSKFILFGCEIKTIYSIADKTEK